MEGETKRHNFFSWVRPPRVEEIAWEGSSLVSEDVEICKTAKTKKMFAVARSAGIRGEGSGQGAGRDCALIKEQGLGKRGKGAATMIFSLPGTRTANFDRGMYSYVPTSVVV